MTRICLFSLIILINFSCSKKDNSSEGKPNYAVWITDSIKVDYLGNLGIFDYDSENGLYLARNNGTEEILLFDETGKINHQFTLQTDGPNAITWAMGIGFLDGQVSILDRKMGIVTLTHEGNIKNVSSIPDEYFHLNGLDFAAHRVGDELAYIKPMREDFDLSNWSETYKSVYKSPIIELLNPISGNIRASMPFPPNTVYESGNFYHWLFPIVRKNGNEWLLSLLAERKYHVYREKNGEIRYEQTVELPLADAIDIKGVPLSRIDDMYETSRNNIFGKIEELYHRKSDILVIYTKGVNEELVKLQDPENQEKWMQFIHGIPRYLAILDSNHQLKSIDIPLPKHLIFSSVMTGNGEILAVKNQESLGLEEDDVTIYKLNVEYK